MAFPAYKTQCPSQDIEVAVITENHDCHVYTNSNQVHVDVIDTERYMASDAGKYQALLNEFLSHKDWVEWSVNAYRESDRAYKKALLEYAQGKVTKNIRDALYPFIDGTCKNFNGQTNVNLDSDYVVIDVSKMPDNLMSVAIYIADDYAYDTIQADRSHRKAIIIDELSRMIGKSGSESAAKFVQVQARTVRGFNCILIMATQDTGDFFSLDDGSYGKTILANCILQVVMKQLPKEAKAISEIMDLSNEESRRIANYDLGNGLLVVNRNHIEMKVHASPLVEELLKTNADPPETQARGQRFR